MKELIRVADEFYLIGIANKGIVKRAQKEVADAGVAVRFAPGELVANFGDGTVVKIRDTLTNFECSCPSRTICKHVIMAILAGQSDCGAIKNAVKDDVAAFDYLLNFTKESLVKTFGKTVFNDTVSAVNKAVEWTFEETGILNIVQSGGLYTVRFLPNSTLDESVCSCKVKNCPHRLEAILCYMKRRDVNFDFEFAEDKGKIDTSVIAYISKLIEEIFATGLHRLHPPEYADKCSQFATLSHGAGFAVFERLFDVCGKEFALYSAKSAAFNKGRLMTNLAHIQRLIQYGEPQEYAGKFKRRYIKLAELNIVGLGGYSWHAKSGFYGVTAVFYSRELNKTLTFSDSRPAETSGTHGKSVKYGVEKMLKSQAWALPVSFENISKGVFNLTGARISEDFRLSSSEGTVGTLVATRGNLSELEFAVDDFADLKKLFNIDELYGANKTYAVLKIAAVEGGGFNEIEQTYSAWLVDKNEHALLMSIAYSAVNEIAILNFEHMSVNNIMPVAVTVSISLGERDIELFPVSVWIDGEVTNIFYEKLYEEADGGASEFSKFFKED